MSRRVRIWLRRYRPRDRLTMMGIRHDWQIGRIIEEYRAEIAASRARMVAVTGIP